MPYPYRSIRDWIADEEKIGCVRRVKTAIKCGDYKSIVEIGNGIPGTQPETEIRSLTMYLHSLPGKPIGIIEKPVNNRPDVPVVINPYSTRERVMRGLGIKNKDEFCEKIEALRQKRIKPVTVSRKEAPCKQVIIPAARLDLRKDIPHCWVEFDKILYSACNGTVIAYDPKTGNHDLGKARFGQYDHFNWGDTDPSARFGAEREKRYGYGTILYAGTQASRVGTYFGENYRSKGKSMPAVFAFGVPVDIHVTAALRGADVAWPEAGDEFEIVGSFRGEPLSVVDSETIPGLKVPADAEWILEGEYLPEDQMTPLTAHDVSSGYVHGGLNWPIFKVNCITHRKGPWWDATTFSCNPGSIAEGACGAESHDGTHTGLQYLHCESTAINHLRRLGFKVKDVVMLAGGREVAVVQLEVDGAAKPYPHYGKQVLMALHGNPGVSIGVPTKYLIAVGPDINPYDFKDVMWALGTRTQPVDDSIVITHGLAQWGDPDGAVGAHGLTAFGQQVMIDALIKVPERHSEFMPRSEPNAWQKEAVKRIKAKLE